MARSNHIDRLAHEALAIMASIPHDSFGPTDACRSVQGWSKLSNKDREALHNRVGELIDEGSKKRTVAEKKKAHKIEWVIYIPEEGHWPINYYGPDKEKARTAYLKWAKRKTLPRGSGISCMTPPTIYGLVVVRRKEYQDGEIAKLANRNIDGWRYGGDQFEGESDICITLPGQKKTHVFAGKQGLNKAVAFLRKH